MLPSQLQRRIHIFRHKSYMYVLIFVEKRKNCNKDKNVGRRKIAWKAFFLFKYLVLGSRSTAEQTRPELPKTTCTCNTGPDNGQCVRIFI